jgi:hypothetical protein
MVSAGGSLFPPTEDFILAPDGVLRVIPERFDLNLVDLAAVGCDLFAVRLVQPSISQILVGFQPQLGDASERNRSRFTSAHPPMVAHQRAQEQLQLRSAVGQVRPLMPPCVGPMLS